MENLDIAIGILFLCIAFTCYNAMRRYDSTDIRIVIVGAIALILGLIGVGYRFLIR